MRVSVIVNTYNRAASLEDCLISLHRQVNADYEVIVVNGPSEDNTELVLEKFKGKIKIGKCSERNLSVSRNIGIALAAGDVCAFIDDDAVAHPTWLSRIAAPYIDDDVAAVGGFTLHNNGVDFQCRYTVCDRHGNAYFFDSVDPTVAFHSPGTWCFPSLLGTNSSFRRSQLEMIGGFDETFEYMLDETDVCLRLYDRGNRILTIPNALVFHRYAESHVRDRERVPRSLLADTRSKAYFCIKHRRSPQTIARALEEIDRYRSDLECSNRSLLYDGRINVAHFNKLRSDVDLGLKEGAILGLKGARAKGDLHKYERTSDHFAPFRSPIRRQLRLCLVSQTYAPNETSGIARWTADLARGLSNLGHEVHVITATTTEATVDYDAGIWVHAIPSSENTIGPLAPVNLPEAVYSRALSVYEEVRRTQSIWGLDLVSAPIWDLEGIICARNLDIPLITSLHSTYGLILPFKDHWQKDAHYRAHHVERMIEGEKWLLQNSDGILANSASVVKDIQTNYHLRLNSGKVHIVPHGTSSVTVGSKVGGPPGKPTRILYVGRIERRKGLDVLLSALLELNGEHNFLIDIVGVPAAGEIEFAARINSLLEQLDASGCTGRLRFHGYVDEANLQELYANCDVFVAPSRYESFGLIAIEAMRFGKPAVVSRVGGLAEVVRHGVDGYLFNPQRPKELAKLLRYLIERPDIAAELGAAARHRFSEQFTIEKMALATEAVYRQIVPPPGR